MKRIKLVLASLLLSCAWLAPVAVTHAATTQTEAEAKICEGLGGCDPVAGEQTVPGIVQTAVDLLSWVVGIAAVFVVIFGGFRYITAAGDSSKISSAKDTILYALIGIAVVAMAQILVRFVIGEVS